MPYPASSPALYGQTYTRDQPFSTSSKNPGLDNVPPRLDGPPSSSEVFVPVRSEEKDKTCPSVLQLGEKNPVDSSLFNYSKAKIVKNSPDLLGKKAEDEPELGCTEWSETESK